MGQDVTKDVAGLEDVESMGSARLRSWGRASMICVGVLGTPIVAAAPRQADLAVSFTRPQEAVAGSEQVTYTVHVANAGPAAATQIKVVNTLPPGTTFASAGGIGWDCDDPVKGTVTCVLPSLAAGANAPPLGIAVTTPSEGGTFKAVATVSATEPDPVPGNNTAEHSVAVSPRKGSTP